ncbi:unnamed protein product [Thlaspi arvense]|uniref:RING-type E3 ubiquitin transferase n=1 Tax=Thlaspi arvense TaxID=13288 RepID=A0AAU9SPU2_THLAR|nr:unnamed protein product [Thlaspi arvense]
MPKQRRVLSMPNKRSRVSPYPLRSSRTNKQKEDEPETPVQTEGPREWEDVRCVICMEPPHNAVLLRCSSSSKGCRAYMCDTSARHSNCFKQYRRSNKNPFNPKAFKCPLCRGEGYETIKVSSARRFMNAKSRSCSIEGCDFSGTYSQLNSHLKTEHPGFIRPRVNPEKQRRWEQMQRDAEYAELMTAAGFSHGYEVVHHQQLPYTHPFIQFSMSDLFGYATAFLPQLEFGLPRE